MAKAYSLVQTSGTYQNWKSMDVTGGSLVSRVNVSAQFFPDDFSVDDYFIVNQGNNIFQYAAFGGATITVTTPIAATSYSLAWEYWDGSAWQALTVTSDTTNDLQNTGVVSWEVPHDWNGGAPNQTAYWSAVRCRVTAVDTPTEGGYGKPNSNQFYIDCSGGTSSDPITFENVYDWAVDTLGRTDLISKFTDNLGDDCYVFYVSLKTADYFIDSSLMVEWRSVGFWFDDNARISYALFLLRRLPGYCLFYTDDTFSYVTTIELDGRQRAVAFAGTGTHSRGLYHLGFALLRTGTTFTLSAMNFPSVGWVATAVTGGYIDYNDSYFGGGVYLGPYTQETYKNVSYRPTNWELTGSVTNGRHTFLNAGTSGILRMNGAPTTQFVFFRWELATKIQDTNGNAIQNALVSFTDEQGNRCEVHARVTATAASGTKVLTVDDSSRFTAGDEITIGANYSVAGSVGVEAAVVASVDSPTQITLVDNLTITVYSSSYIRNDTVGGVLTNSSGEIYTQPLLQKTWQGNGGIGQTAVDYSEHTIQISKSGYITQTHKITMDEKRDLVFTLERQVPLYIGRGRAFVNADPANGQNSILV